MSDQGRAWTGIASSADGSQIVAVASFYDGMYISYDGGNNWVGRETGRIWRSVASSSSGNKLVAGTYSDLIYVSG